MSYLESFLVQHARQERGGTEATKATEAPFVPFVASRTPRVELVSAAGPALRLDHHLAVREVLGLPAALLHELPVPATLVLEVRGANRPVTVGAHRGCPPAVFDAAEWLALTLAAENDRALCSQFEAWCERKRREPRWRLAEAEAIGPVFGIEPQRWTVGRVLGQLGADLRLVVLQGGEEPKGTARP